MRTTKIKDWKGYELSEDYAQFVMAGIAEASAIVSKQSGSLARTISSDETHKGFSVFVDARMLKGLQGEDYSERYALKGYTNWPPFHFIAQGFMNLSDDDNYKGGSWSARVPSGRRGSGTSSPGLPRSIAPVKSWLNNRKSTSGGSTIGRLRK